MFISLVTCILEHITSLFLLVSAIDGTQSDFGQPHYCSQGVEIRFIVLELFASIDH